MNGAPNQGGAARRRLSVGLAAAALIGGCQPALESQLPHGAAAYQAIGAPAEPGRHAAAYLLRPGDRISVNIFQEPDLSQRELQIDEAGAISLPLIGDTQAAGLSPGELSRAIETLYGGRFLRAPQANVALVEARARTVSVEGHVVRPGVYPIQPGHTLLSAMALASSPAPDARLDEVLIFRTLDGQRLGGRFDLTEIRSGRMPDPEIRPDDVVVVGFSSLRGIYRDILQAAPLLGSFAVLSNANN